MQDSTTTATTTTGSSGPERRRRRPPLACVTCRRRKVRCDRKMPCQNCVRARKATSCAYVPDDRVEPAPRGAGEDDDTVLSAQPQPYLSPATTHAGSSGGMHYQSSESSAASKRLAEKVELLEKQLRMVLESKDRRGGPERVTAGQKAMELNTELAMDGESCVNSNVMLAKSRYLGSSHWMHGVSLFPRSNTILGLFKSINKDNTSETYQAMAASKSLGRTIKAARVPNLVGLEFGKSIPCRETADKLLEAYLRTFETVYRVLHVPSFRNEYNRYWENPSAAREPFVIQLQLCMALGAVVHGRDFAFRTLAVRWVYEARLWVMQPSEKGRINLSGIQVWCLVHLARDICGVNPDMVWASAGTLMRMALYIGLHRDPQSLPKMSILAAETRRRLWATILEILVQSSMDSGGPPLISMDDFDTERPGNYNDEDLLSEEIAGQQPAPKPLTTFTDTSVQIALLRSVETRIQIASYLNKFRSIPTYDQTLALNSELTAASRSLDASLHGYQNQEPGLSVFQLRTAEHAIQRYFLALHLPWLGQAKTDPRFFFSRKICVDVSLRNQEQAAAHGYAAAPGDSKTDDFGRALICGSGGLRYIGVQCILVLVLELMWELEEHRDAARCLSPGGSGTVPRPSGTPNMGYGLSRGRDIMTVIQSSSSWLKTRIRAGEVNVKGYFFARALIAEVEGLQRGLSDEELDPLVRNAALEAALETLGMLKEMHLKSTATAGDVVSHSAEIAGINLQKYTGMDGTPVNVGRVDDSAAMDPVSTGQPSDWDWDIIQDPGFNINFNLGGMDLIFGNVF